MFGLAVLVGGLTSDRSQAQAVDSQIDERTADPLPPAAPAPPGHFLLRVPGGQAVYERLGLRPEERGYALVLLSRALHGAAVANPSGSMAVAFTEVFGPLAEPAGSAGAAGAAAAVADEGMPVSVLAPFTDRFWRETMAIDVRADLFTTIVRTRGALLVASSALEAGPGVREWLVGQPRLVQEILRAWPGAFAQVARALALTEQGWATPGDRAAWTAVVGVGPDRTVEFLRRLLNRDEGRLARFFATLASLPAERRDGLLRPAAAEGAAATLASLYDATKEAEAPWSPNLHPFQLSYADLPSVLMALADLDIEALPATAARWPALVTGSIGSREDAAELLRRDGAEQPYAATVRALLRGGPRDRRDRIAVLSIARRIWHAEQTPQVQADALYALGHFKRFRALLLMLDRIDVRDPTVWARLVDAARRVDEGGGTSRAQRVLLMQGALALVERTSLVDAISQEQREGVLRALAEALDSQTDAPTAVQSWLLDTFVPALPPLVRPDRYSGTTAYESRILQALAGPPSEAPPHIAWEGLNYTVDVAAAEHQRILDIRRQLPSPGLDAAIAGHDPAALGAALRALAYAVALGDPEGAVTLSPDVVDRHDLIGLRSSGREFAWRLAVERTGSGAPWHVDGGLLALDLALARSSLRRLSADDMPPVPTINLNDELTLARTAVALRSQHFDDRTRAALVAAIARGRQRVARAADDPAAVAPLAAAVALPVAVRNSLAWTLASTPGAGAHLFSLRDLLWLGEPVVPAETRARWGVMGDAVDGRLATRFDAPVAWDRLAGRPDTGVLATQVPDLTLRLAEVTATLGVPAALIPSLLLYATQDYWHEVEARFADDWPALGRGALSLPATRVEDYVAALTSGGPLRPE